MHPSGIIRLLILLSCTCALFAQGIPSIASVVNAASQDNRLSPACLADIIGTNLGTSASAGVLIGGQQATVISRSSTRWRVWIPDSVQPGPTTIQLGASQIVPITLTQYSPALFSADGTGLGIVSALGYRLAPNDALITPGYQLSETTPAKLGDILILDVTGLGAPDWSNEGPPPMEPPIVTIGGKQALVPWAFLVTNQTDPDLCYGTCQPWHYEVAVSLPDSMAVHDQLIALTIGGATSQTLTVPINATPIVNAAVNAASFAAQAPLVAGSLASVFGTTFGVTDQSSGLPAHNTTGVSVTFNGAQSPLLAVWASLGLINLQVPVELPDAGPATMNVTTASGVSADFTVQLSPAAPGVFRIPSSNRSRPPVAAVLFNNTQWLVAPNDFAQELNIAGNCHASGIGAATICGEPAQRGIDYLQIYVTGMGKSYPNGDSSQPILGTGQAAPLSGNPLYWTLLQPTVTVGGVPAQPVLFCGVAPGFIGLYQINIQVPAAAPTGNYIPLVITTPNGAADNTTTIAIR